MLTEKRQEEILKIVEQNGSVTVQELTERLKSSESTIRRDLNAMDQKGLLIKVFGGAVKTGASGNLKEELVEFRQEIMAEEKQRIGKYAASLIQPEDFVYLDAGTTTGAMLPFITETTAVFVTNAVSHALELTRKGFQVILIGGTLKASTEALVGNEAYETLQKYNFTKGFMGTNGIDRKGGFTTPDLNEALVKKCALQHTSSCYILADAAKFHKITPVRFAEYGQATILTDRCPDESFREDPNLCIVP